MLEQRGQVQQEFISFGKVKARLGSQWHPHGVGSTGMCCGDEWTGSCQSGSPAAAAAPHDGSCQAENRHLQDHLEHPPCALQPPGEPVTWSIDGAPLGLWPC